MKTSSKLLKHPFFVVVVGVCLGFLGNRYLGQISFHEQADRKTLDETISKMNDVEVKVADFAEKTANSSKIFVNAFKDPTQRADLIDSKRQVPPRIEANAIQYDYDRSIGGIEAEIKKYFPSNLVGYAWQNLDESLGTLDDDVDDIKAHARKKLNLDEDFKNYDMDYDRVEHNIDILKALMEASIASVQSDAKVGRSVNVN